MKFFQNSITKLEITIKNQKKINIKGSLLTKNHQFLLFTVLIMFIKAPHITTLSISNVNYEEILNKNQK